MASTGDTLQSLIPDLLFRAVQSLPQGFVLTDATRPDNPIVYCNAGFGALTGYSPEEIIGRNCRFLQGPNTDPASLDAIRQAVREERGVAVALQNYRKDGNSFWNALTITPLRREDGAVAFFIGVQTDISSVKAMEAQLLKAQKLDTVGLLTASVAHDFNNLLTVINGYSEMAVSELPEGELRDMVGEVLTSGRRAGALTRQLLAFTRMQESQRGGVDLNELVRASERLLYGLVGSRVKLSFELDPEAPLVFADAAQLEQIILNFAANARDAMPEEGSLTIRTKRASLRSGRNGVILEVSDTGEGMDEAVRQRIFEPLFTTKPIGRGTGLGLATVQRIVADHDGTIEVESTLGVGTTFRVALPAADPRALGTVRDALRSTVRGTEVVVLIENDAVVRAVTARFLRLHGYTVLEAATGADARGMWNRDGGRPHVVISDVDLPDLPPLRLLQTLREELPTAGVLFLSGFLPEGEVRAEIARQKIPLVAKPFTQTELLTKVREAIDTIRRG